MDKSYLNILDDFIASINNHKLDVIVEHLSENHLFIDSLNNKVVGKKNMFKAWEAYLRMFPDYNITIKEKFIKNNSIIILGTASGTFYHNGKLLSENYWSIPAAWKCEITNNKISLWQIFADNSPIKDIIDRLSHFNSSK